MSHVPFALDAPITFAMAVAFSLVACGFAALRRVHLPRRSLALIAIALLFLSLAAGRLTWSKPAPPRVAVMIDISASTRTATYHDTNALTQRVQQLLGDTPFTTYFFSDQAIAGDTTHPQTEAPATETKFTPPPVDAIILFSDARFALPSTAPPTFIVVDPALDHTTDATAVNLQAQGNDLLATIRNTTDAPRQVGFTSAIPATQSAPLGETSLSATLSPSATSAEVAIRARDDWPENNNLDIIVPPPSALDRWWITASGASGPTGWIVKTPAQLSDDDAPLVNAGVIALANVPADALSRFGLEHLEQYVRDAGGGLLIVGGERAFAAGGYTGTALDRLSPLSSNPPTPVSRWVLLIDSSGSMSASVGDNTRLNFATFAAVRLFRTLPAHDLLSVGDFARDVRWWTKDTPVESVDLYHIAPRDLRPSGPTNLQPALEQLAGGSDGSLATQVIIVTDAEARIDNAANLISALKNKRVRVSVLSIDPLDANKPLKQIVEQTGGIDLAAADPRNWFDAMRQLFKTASPSWIERSPLAVRFLALTAALPAQTASPWNRTWLKPNATLLATGRADDQDHPAVAAWKIGVGAVLSAAYMPSEPVIESLAEIVATPPRDPRFTITWQTDSQLRVSIDAVDNGQFVNDLHPVLAIKSVQSQSTEEHAIPQTAPGHYELSLPAPRTRALATILLDHHLLDRRGIAGRYAPEFDAVGNDRAAMRELAARTGGRIIEPSDTTPLKLPQPMSQKTPLTTPLTLAAALCIAAALIFWRLR